MYRSTDFLSMVEFKTSDRKQIMELQETLGQHGDGHINRVEGGLGKAWSLNRERKG